MKLLKQVPATAKAASKYMNLSILKPKHFDSGAWACAPTPGKKGSFDGPAERVQAWRLRSVSATSLQPKPRASISTVT